MKTNSHSNFYILVDDNIPFGEYRLSRGEVIHRNDKEGSKRYGRIRYFLKTLARKHYYTCEHDNREALLSDAAVKASFYHWD